MNSKVKDYALRTVKSLILPAMVYLFFLLAGNGRFGSGASMLVIARQSVMPILLSFALAFNMSIGMWDFSAGGVVYVACIVGGNMALLTGAGLIGLIFFCVATAVIMTTITALLYNFVKVPSIVLTIGLVLVYEASTSILFGGKGVLISGDLTILSRSPYCFIILAVMFALFYIVFNFTSFGHNVRALGNGQLIARNAGLSPSATKFKSFVFGGLFLGAAAVINISARGKLTVATNMISVSTVFDAMMGIFIGLFLAKYCNMAIGVAIGAFTMKMLNTGLIALGLSTTVRDISSGLFLLLILIVSNNQGLFGEMKARRERAASANANYLASQKINT